VVHAARRGIETRREGRAEARAFGVGSRGSTRAWRLHAAQRADAATARPCDRLTPEDAAGLYPSLGTDDLRSVLFEPEAGVLYARLATRALASGLPLRPGRATPADPPAAEVVVWACGAWLPGLFPELVHQRISRRDVFFVGVDAAAAVPACEYDGPYYGHGELGGYGMKISPDGPGRVDPTWLSGCRSRAGALAQRTRLGGSRRSPARRSSARVSASTT
jgi:glycine/D-amino acid oxidase-like deaminating enzyme